MILEETKLLDTQYGKAYGNALVRDYVGADVYSYYCSSEQFNLVMVRRAHHGQGPEAFWLPSTSGVPD